MSEVEASPLHGEGRAFGRLVGLRGELMAEFFGTFVLIALGDGVAAMAVAALPGSGRAPGSATVGDWLLITGGWALAVAFGVWVAGGVSGAHINPAVTLALAVRRRFPWQKVLPYCGSQVTGAFAGAALVFLVYRTAINAFDLANGTPKNAGDALATFSIFATFPARYFGHSVWGPLIDQFVGTAFLVICIAAVSDKRNQEPKGNISPLVVGLAVALIGMSYGANAGYAINPARDFGPRLFAFFAGWGRVALPGTCSTFSNYWWIPVAGPLVGGVIGIMLYDFFIGDVLRARLPKAPPSALPQIPVPPARPVPAEEADQPRPASQPANRGHLSQGLTSRRDDGILMNHSSTACHVFGYPGPAFFDNGGFPMATHLTWVKEPHATMVLRPGGAATAMLTWRWNMAGPDGGDLSYPWRVSYHHYMAG